MISSLLPGGLIELNVEIEKQGLLLELVRKSVFAKDNINNGNNFVFTDNSLSFCSWKELKDEKPEVAHSHSQVNER